MRLTLLRVTSASSSSFSIRQALEIAQVGEDKIFGIVYRADLANVANADNVLIDMKFDIADASGNTTSFVMEPAFAVGRDSWFGRRGPHR